jgi:hypothetical protein
MTICVIMFVRVVSEPDRDRNPRGPRPAVAARPLNISRPFSTVIISGRLTSIKPPTFSRASGIVLIPLDGLGLIGRLTMVTGHDSSLSVMRRTAVVGTSWSAAMRSVVASAVVGGFANTMTINPIAAALLATQLVDEAITLNLVVGLIAVFLGIWVATTGLQGRNEDAPIPRAVQTVGLVRTNGTRPSLAYCTRAMKNAIG